MLNTTSTNVSNNELISCNPNAIYGDVDHHICCLIPIYIDGGDYTACYYVDGRREIVHKSIKTVLKEVAHHEGSSSKRHSIFEAVKADVYGP